jgi:hypothetical protein
MFAWIRDEPEALVVWVESLEDKEALVASERHRSLLPAVVHSSINEP